MNELTVINKILYLIVELGDSEIVTEMRLTSADRAQQIFALLITQLYNWHRSQENEDKLDVGLYMINF